VKDETHHPVGPDPVIDWVRGLGTRTISARDPAPRHVPAEMAAREMGQLSLIDDLTLLGPPMS
jgi:hypothetical protein